MLRVRVERGEVTQRGGIGKRPSVISGAYLARVSAFLHYGWGIRCERLEGTALMLRCPYRFGNTVWALCDNGGEWSLFKFNAPDFYAIPHGWGEDVTAATLCYRIGCCLSGEPWSLGESWPDSDLTRKGWKPE